MLCEKEESNVICDNPYVSNGRAFGCGQCVPCRVRRRRVWKARIMLESRLVSSTSFVTLTYSPENLPFCAVSSGGGESTHPLLLGSLRRRHLTLFLKRLRKKMAPQLIRYYAVGEYGRHSERPHYHLAVFGGPVCQRGLTDLTVPVCCPVCDMYVKAWSVRGKALGSVQVGSLRDESAGYIAQYVTKKMTRGEDELWLRGREPEFQAMSNRPGIGYGALFDVVDTMFRHQVDCTSDVPGRLRFGSDLMDVGRYLRGKLRLLVGRDEKAPPATLAAIEESLQLLRAIAFYNSSSFKAEIVKDSEPKREAIKSREVRFAKRETI